MSAFVKSPVAALLFLLCCTSEEKKAGPTSARASLVTKDIVWSLIQQGRIILPSQKLYGAPLASSLQSIRLIPPVAEGSKPPPTYDFVVSLSQLLYYTDQEGQPFFGQQDSLFLLQQGKGIREEVLNTAEFAPTDLFLYRPWERGAKPKAPPGVYRLSMPLFSRDSMRAYIQLDHVCFRCGTGTAYFLVKDKGEWQIALSEERWATKRAI